MTAETNYRGFQVIVLAGGLATRMRPLTESTPKAMLMVNEKPFVHYQLTWLRDQGITDVVFCIGYKGEQISDYVKDGAQWSMKVRYSNEGDQLMGTAGAIRKACDQGLVSEKFAVIYGDSYLRLRFFDVARAFLCSNMPALMTVIKNRDQWEVSNAVFQSNQIKLYKKNLDPRPVEMIFTDYGLLFFNRALFLERIPSRQKEDLAILLERLSEDGLLAGFEAQDRFFEIGSVQGLEELKGILK